MSHPIDQDLTASTPARGRGKPTTFALYPLTPGAPASMVVLDRPSLVIGRRSAASETLAFDDALMSRVHAELCRLKSGLYTLIDRGSKNGTYHNKRPADGSVIAFGDVLRLGDTVLVVGRPASESADRSSALIGRSALMVQLRERLQRLGPSALTVLLQGESGTGKEVAARILHDASGVRGAFVPVNCAAIAPQLAEREIFGHVKGAYTGASESGRGFIEAAQNGTLFLDEIGDLSLGTQAKLLRFLEDRSYTPVGSSRPRQAETRVIAATNRDLASMVVSSTFRDDLYARLEEAPVLLPALRDRREDLGGLVEELARREGSVVESVSADAMEALALYNWPRNVRELVKIIKRLPVFHPGTRVLDLDQLPVAIQAPLIARYEADDERDGGVKPISRQELELSLQRHTGNVSQVAREFDRERKQIYRWIKRYEIDTQRYRDSSDTQDD